MTGIKFNPYTIEIDGISDAVRYTIRRGGTLIVHLAQAACEMELTPADPDYAAALKAANARQVEEAIRGSAKLDADRASGLKWWVGQTIKGRGWRIEASASYERIRVIFDRRPGEAQKAAVIEAGFHWSPTLKSWNRGLKCKAWRAAEQLAVTLKDLGNPDAAARREFAAAKAEAKKGSAAAKAAPAAAKVEAKKGAEAAKAASPAAAKVAQSFAGQHVAFTGTIEGMTRREAIAEVERRGGRGYMDMPVKTTLLVVGRDPGASKRSKLERADQWIGKVRKITEAQFRAMLAEDAA